MKAPRIVLICCEGKTEKEYFEIIKDVFRGPYSMRVEVHGEKGQHKALVDRTACIRSELVEELELPIEECVAWAVCDDDGMGFSFMELKQYAEEKDVRLAFSRPQFEAFLVQHFSPMKEHKKEELFSALSRMREQYGFEGEYCDGTKADLSWLEQAIRDKPKLVDTAIRNANLRKSWKEKTFLTVQGLVEFIKQFEIR